MQTPEDVARETIRRERDQRKWSQQTLSRRVAIASGNHVDLHPTAVTRIEKGQRGITLDEAVAIANALGITVAQLIGEDEIDQPRLARQIALDKISTAAEMLYQVISLENPDMLNNASTQQLFKAVGEAEDE